MPKYKTIVIDPPWRIKLAKVNRNARILKTNTIDGRGKINYDLMDDTEIAEFPIDDFADDRCDLFMWTIQNRLPVAFNILKQWKFNYKRTITWHKQIGFDRVRNLPLLTIAVNGFKYDSEFLIHATRGKTHFKYTAPLFNTVQQAKTRGHSVKPPEIYQKLREKTAEPRIDIFARHRHDGFDAWGDQIEPVLQTTLGEAEK